MDVRPTELVGCLIGSNDSMPIKRPETTDMRTNPLMDISSTSFIGMTEPAAPPCSSALVRVMVAVFGYFLLLFYFAASKKTNRNYRDHESERPG